MNYHKVITMNKLQKSYNLQTEQPIDYNKGLKLILKHTRKYILPFSLISLCLLAASIIGSYFIPKLTKYAIDVNMGNKDINGLIHTTIIFIALVIIYLILSYIRIYFLGKLGQTILFDIRQDLFEKIQKLPNKFFSDNQSGDIIQRLTGNVDSISSFFNEGVMRFLDITFSLVIIMISLFVQNTTIGLISVGGAFVMILFVIIQGRVMEHPLSESLRKEGIMSATVQESLDGFVAIQVTNQQSNWIKKFEKKSQDYYSVMKKVSLLSAISKAGLTALGVILVGVILFVSLNLFKLQIITIGTVILILSYTEDILSKTSGIAEIWRNIKTGIASAQRLSDVMDLHTDILNKENAFKPKEIKGDIDFEDVDFSYVQDEKVLSDVNFSVKAGQTIAVVGPTGAGKTTFVNLIARLYDADNGHIYIDHEDIRNWDLDTLRQNIGYLIQDTFLFEDTILNNLKYNNKKVTEDTALKMFKTLGAESFIQSLPNGLNTIISTENTDISAGQKQIIALARILLRDPKILILDEATARVDTKSEKMLQKAISIACKGKTTFIIAHRLSTIFNADQIILIKDNTILEKGTHTELLNLKGFYYEMYSRFVGK